MFGKSRISELEAENARLRKSLARAWAAYLDLAVDLKLEDGTPVLTEVLCSNPELRKRLFDPTPTG